jgi:hypothetical protein
MKDVFPDSASSASTRRGRPCKSRKPNDEKDGENEGDLDEAEEPPRFLLFDLSCCQFLYPSLLIISRAPLEGPFSLTGAICFEMTPLPVV